MQSEIERAYKNLALAVVVRAMDESRARDDHKRLSALDWLITTAPLWLDSIGINYRLDDFYDRILKRRQHV